MRLILIPISTRRTLIYGQRLNLITTPHPSKADKASARAAKLWLQWETGNRSWQRRFTEYGNKLFSRIPFEEWGLKSIPPLSARRHQQEIAGKKVDVLYPASIIGEKDLPQILHKLATERSGLHRKRAIWSLVGMPISAPLGLVPLIPNIPFFYLAYRAFSHWKALAGATHLKFLVDCGLYNPVKSSALDKIYTQKNMKTALSYELQTREGFSGLRNVETISLGQREYMKEVLLLQDSDAQAIAKGLGIQALGIECERACQQVSEQLKVQAEKEAQLLRAAEVHGSKK